jgi:hypothetical protein
MFGNWKMGVEIATSFSFDHQAYADKKTVHSILMTILKLKNG